MAVNVWVALHGIVSLRASRPNHAWPPVDTLIEAALSGQVGLAGTQSPSQEQEGEPGG